MLVISECTKRSNSESYLKMDCLAEYPDALKNK